MKTRRVRYAVACEVLSGPGVPPGGTVAYRAWKVVDWPTYDPRRQPVTVHLGTFADLEAARTACRQDERKRSRPS